MNFTPLRKAGMSALIVTSIALGTVSAGAQQSTPNSTPTSMPIVCHDYSHGKPGELNHGKKYETRVNVTLDQAIATAKDEVSGDIGPIDLEHEDDVLVYEVQVGQQEVLIDAETGDVVKVGIGDGCYWLIGDVRFEDDDALADTVSISPEKAIEIAQGENAGTVRSVELEEDDGVITYEVDFGSTEVTIDANSGNVLDIDNDND